MGHWEQIWDEVECHKRLGSSATASGGGGDLEGTRCKRQIPCICALLKLAFMTRFYAIFYDQMPFKRGKWIQREFLVKMDEAILQL